MKIKKKKASLEEDGSSSLYSGGAPSWAITDPKKFGTLAKQARVEQRRIPELWIRDGEGRLVRYLDEDPVVSFQAYRMQLNGRWQRFVRPIDGKPDLFASRLGLRPSRMFVYRIIDIDGYTDKKGKKFTNLPRFHVVGVRQFEQNRLLVEEHETTLNAQNIKIKRSGSGQNTTYLLIPKQPSPLTLEMKKAAANFPKWQEFFQPPTTSQQKSMLASIGGGEDDEDKPF